MQDIQALLDRIASIKAQLANIRRPRSSNPKSKNYIVNYDELVKVHNGYVHPSILAMYAKEA